MKPSVTNLLNMLNKPGLIKWANKMGFKGVDVGVFKESSRERGTSRHKVIEDFANGVLSEDQELNDKMVRFFSDKKIIDTEMSFETEYFVGRYDIKLIWNDLTFVCDYKSSQKIYFENKLQLAAYMMATGCERSAVIHFPDLLINPVDINIERYSEFLITLSKLYQLKEEIDR
jgi:hypothetical protein